VRQDQLGPQDHSEPQETMVAQGLQDNQDPLELPDYQGILVQTVIKDHKEPKDQRELQVPRDLMVSQDLQDLLVQEVHQDWLEI